MQLHIFISGKVQGVFLRDQTKTKALQFGLKGFVKNLEDGRVEVVAQGDMEMIRNLIVFLKKDVKDAEVQDLEIKEEPD